MNCHTPRRTTTSLLIALTIAATAQGQDSSLYLQTDPSAAAAARFGAPASDEGFAPTLNADIARMSIAVVTKPRPKVFRKNDLITIIVRETFESSSDADLSTEKEMEVEGEVSAFPRLTLQDLVDFQLRSSELGDDAPAVGVTFKRGFDGTGSTERKDQMSGRITARVLDVKPNGTLVLEARKHLQADKEAVTIVATGMCRAADISAVDNTVLSTALHDLHIVKKTEGELHKASKKGLLTKILDGLFAF